MRVCYTRYLVIAEIRDYLPSVWKCIFAYRLRYLKMTTKTQYTPNKNARIRRRRTPKKITTNPLSPSLLLKPKHLFSIFFPLEIYFMFGVNSFFFFLHRILNWRFKAITLDLCTSFVCGGLCRSFTMQLHQFTNWKENDTTDWAPTNVEGNWTQE